MVDVIIELTNYGITYTIPFWLFAILLLMVMFILYLGLSWFTDLYFGMRNDNDN